MGKRLVIVALVVGILPTLFSCSKVTGAGREAVENKTSVQKLEGYEVTNGINIDLVITDKDTIVIYNKYGYGAVIVERKPIIK